MAQVNVTLSQEEILHIFAEGQSEGIKLLMTKILNEVMRAESDGQLGAGRHERTEERQDYRNGSRERAFKTRIGTLVLDVPRHRNEPFHTMVFEKYSRSEASLIATIVQMVINGVSTRKVSKVVEVLCGETVSKSSVSELCKRLDKDINHFKTQPLDGLDAPFLIVDATYFKAREEHRILSKAFLVALAIKSDGQREVVSFGVYDKEDNYAWKFFFEDLKERGLTSIRLIVSDAHKSIRYAIAKVYPEVAWQRCQVHFMRNILEETSPKHKEGLKLELREMFSASTVKEARNRKDQIARDYDDVAPKAIDLLEQGFEDAMSVMCLPEYIRVPLRTSNLLERLNRELKRRSDVIQIFPNAASVLRLMGAVTMEYSEAQSAKQRIFTEDKYKALCSASSSVFLEIAQMQMSLLEVA